MKSPITFQQKLICPLLLMTSLWSAHAVAGSATLTLTRSTLTNVSDAAGTWQHEGGKVMKGTAEVGSYALHRRVTTGGTDKLNTAMTTVTLFLNTAQQTAAPRNITIEGAWNFSSGRFLGSVSAASSTYNWVQDADVQGSPGAATGTTNMVINWLQSTGLTLP